MTSVKLVNTVLLSKVTLLESSTTIPSLIGALIQFPLPEGTSIQATSAETKSRSNLFPFTIAPSAL